jgi:iron complex transport system substrate-binding protein
MQSLDTGLLEELKPDLVITQDLCDVCAVSLSVIGQAVARFSCSPRILSTKPSVLNEVLGVS